MTFRNSMLTLLGVVIIIALGAVGMGFWVSGPRYSGPITDHFDGREFRNLPDADGKPVEAKGFREVISWLFTRERTEPWPAYHNDPPAPAPAPRVGGDSVRVTFVNHSTVLLQFDGLNVLTDPVWYERVSPFQFAGPKRNRPPGIRFEDLPKIDLILLSHNHWDHLDIGTVEKIWARDQPRLVCPLGVKAFLEQKGYEKVTELDWRQAYMFDANTTIHCVPAQHFSGRGLFDRNASLWAGFVIDSKVAGKLYFVGDTGYGPFLKTTGEQFGPFRLALVPIGAFKPEWFMAPIHVSPEQAVQLHKDVRSEQSVAIHFGTFPLADDGEEEPVEQLQKALRQHQIDPAKFRVLRNGEGLTVD
ncbi:twin-arginine translocation pathway signal [Rudanella paleaurantiibacter]|uniref:Twin-arginine translocation pathway signal n=2 Tax=Rudanella paleaurantiibacter TaxID=2614655 RepID=A0A7J5U2Y0_9BACT|nr:twin-arginine translocation pathway signal [Rudanella paleaurantiibacter]